MSENQRLNELFEKERAMSHEADQDDIPMDTRDMGLRQLKAENERLRGEIARKDEVLKQQLLAMNGIPEQDEYMGELKHNTQKALSPSGTWLQRKINQAKAEGWEGAAMHCNSMSRNTKYEGESIAFDSVADFCRERAKAIREGRGEKETE